MIQSITLTCPSCNGTALMQQGSFEFDIEVEECEEHGFHLYVMLMFDCPRCGEKDVIIDLVEYAPEENDPEPEDAIL